MKQNTKFLWMYVLILFSFALILILFAGLNRYSKDEEEKGLTKNVATLSKENTELRDELKEVTVIKNEKEVECEKLKTEYEYLKINEKSEDDTDALIMKAINAKESGNELEFNDTISKINVNDLNQIQLYVYNSLVPQN